MNNYEEQLKEQLKEIDKDNRSLQQENIYLREKCEKLQITVKEVREEIIKYKEILETGAEQNVFYIYLDSPIQKLEELLEILDKGE